MPVLRVVLPAAAGLHLPAAVTSLPRYPHDAALIGTLILLAIVIVIIVAVWRRR
ncbi:hypothetical protein ABZ897_36845 [Nonomuraea sp. NPDC046802]|uniref:hypothetical protein n=1 Tax=Nonomuraea sp. NPDC046802 TaxID=3154919 RepID=UPI0033D84CB9